MDKSNSDIEVHILSSLRRNQERIESNRKLGKHRAKYFGELALSHKVAVHKSKQNDQRQLLSRVNPQDLALVSSLGITLSPGRSPLRSPASVHAQQSPLRKYDHDYDDDYDYDNDYQLEEEGGQGDWDGDDLRYMEGATAMDNITRGSNLTYTCE